jgi:hypothetical protein
MQDRQLYAQILGIGLRLKTEEIHVFLEHAAEWVVSTTRWW